jgi:arginase
MPSRRYAIIEAPSNLGLRPTGVERLGEAVSDEPVAERLGARRAMRVEPLAYRHGRDPETLILNAPAIVEWSPRLADAFEEVIATGDFPVVLGGDCTILLGTMLALRRRGRFGLLFIDGHADFYQPEAEPEGEGASMELALATGHGPDLLTNLEGRRPLVREEDVVVLGYRDHDDQEQYGSQPLPETMRTLDFMEVRRIGMEAAAQAAITHLTRDELDGFFIHFDADCLDDAIMPAVEYRLPGGLSPREAKMVVGMALDSGKAVGIEVTIYNPNLDRDGSAGRVLTDLLAEALVR